MKNLIVKTGVVTTLAIFSFSAFAASRSATKMPAPSSQEDLAPAEKSVAEADLLAPKEKQLPLTIIDAAVLYGPTVNDPFGISVTDDSVDATTGITFRNQFNFKYKLNSQLTLTPVLDFDYQLTDPDAARNGVRQFRWRDSYVKLTHSSLWDADFSGNKFAVPAGVRLYAPTSKTARESNTIGAIRLDLNPEMTIAGSRFSVSTANYVKVWAQTNRFDRSHKSLPSTELYAGPQLNYAFNDSAIAFVLYEVSVRYNTLGVPNTNDPKKSLADLEPGASFKVHKRVALTPYLNWFTNQPISTTTLNLNADLTLF
jgi:hypothetical protein